MEANEITSLTTQVTADALAHWSDAKRKEFIDTFDQRVRVSRMIAIRTAEAVLAKATEKSFINQRNSQELGDAARHMDVSRLYDHAVGAEVQTYYRSYIDSVGGRRPKDLEVIAQERADNILSSLPPLKEAVRIINPDMAKTIEERDKLLAAGKKLFEEARVLSGPLDMDDFDGKTTIADFKAFVKEREKKRKALLDKLSEVGKDGQELSDKINKFLYAGLPGLSDAVIQVVKDLLDRSTALEIMFRRVSEQVQFGDSKAALEVLSGFERDELSVSDQIKEQFDNALNILKLSVQPKTTKQLKKGKK